MVSETLVRLANNASSPSAASMWCAARLREILALKRMDNVHFEVVPAEDLPVNPRTRKFQIILDRRALDRRAG